MSVYSNIFRTLVAAFNGTDYGGKSKIRSGHDRNLTAPSMVWNIGTWTTEPFDKFKTLTRWDLPAEIKIQCEPGDPFAPLDAIEALTLRGDLASGLPYDTKTGDPILAGAANVDALTRAGRVGYHGERFVGPTLRTMRPRPNEGDTGLAIVDTVWRIEVVIDATPAPLGVARQFTIGTNIGDPAGAWLKQPLDEDTQIVIPVDADMRSQGVFSEPDTTLRGGGRVYRPGFPPLIKPLPMAAGPSEDRVVREIDVQPRTASVSTTRQMTAIALYANYETELITNRVQWASTDTNKATVNSTGLVTKVAAGSVTITATYAGVSGSAALTIT